MFVSSLGVDSKKRLHRNRDAAKRDRARCGLCEVYEGIRGSTETVRSEITDLFEVAGLEDESILDSIDSISRKRCQFGCSLVAVACVQLAADGMCFDVFCKVGPMSMPTYGTNRSS